MLLTLTIIALCGAGVLLYFWHNVIHYFQTTVIPWVRITFGETNAEILGKVLSYADNVATMLRRQIVAGWKWIRHNILGAGSTYEQLDSSSVKVINKVYVHNKTDQSVYEQTATKTVSWSELPASVREQMIKNNVSSVEVDNREILEEQYRSRAEKEGISMEDAA